MEKQILHLARKSREVYAAKISYQRLRMEELEMIRSIMQDQLEVSQVYLNGSERQIGQIRQGLFSKGGIAGGKTGSTEQWTRVLEVDASSRVNYDSDSDSDAASSYCGSD